MRIYLRRRWLFLSFWLKPAGSENEGLRKIGNRRKLRTLRVFLRIAYSTALLWAVYLAGEKIKRPFAFPFSDFARIRLKRRSKFDTSKFVFVIRLGCVVREDVLLLFVGTKYEEIGNEEDVASLDREQNREYAKWKEKCARYYETVQNRRKRWNFDEPSARTSVRTPRNFDLYLLYIYTNV